MLSKRLLTRWVGRPSNPSKAARALLCTALTVLTAGGTPAFGEAADCSFFEGKTVELIVPFNPGGGFDAYGRIVAKYMGPEIGAENMIVRNQPGAGGLLATNQTWTADPDGLRIQLMATSGMLASELAGAAGVNFRSVEFSWIGRVTGEPDVITVGPQGEITKIEDIETISSKRKVRIGSTGIGDIDYVGAKVLTQILGINSDVIVGFSGAREVYASMARGELDIFTSSSSMARQAQATESATIKWLFDTEPNPDLPEIPPIGDFAQGEDVALVRAHRDLVASGRALAGPPGMEVNRLECLRNAFDRTMKNSALLAEAKQTKRPVAPVSGNELNAIITRLTTEVPQAYLAILTKAYSN